VEIAWGTKLQRNEEAEKSPDEKNPPGLLFNPFVVFT
jgi:hypothetical protein